MSPHLETCTSDTTSLPSSTNSPMANLKESSDNISTIQQQQNHHQLLSIIITTSAIEAHPDLSMISRVFRSLKPILHKLDCQLIVTFDGYKTIKNQGKQLTKSCRIHQDLAERYEIYVKNCQEFIKKEYSELFGILKKESNRAGNGESGIEELEKEDAREMDNRYSRFNHDDYLEIKTKTDIGTLSFFPDILIHHQMYYRPNRISSTTANENCKEELDESKKLTRDPNLVFLHFSDRFGFALAVREALAYVKTPYVLVVQHDWELLCPDFNIIKLIHTMQQYNHIMNYVGLPSSASIRYSEREWKERHLPPVHCIGHLSDICEHCLNERNTLKGHQPEDNMNSNIDENQSSITSPASSQSFGSQNSIKCGDPQLTAMPCGNVCDPSAVPINSNDKESDSRPVFSNKKESSLADPLCHKYYPETMDCGSSHKGPHRPSFKLNGLEFLRLYFWYDKPHIASTEYYKNNVFGKGYFKRGDFIEDVFGHKMMNDIRQHYVESLATSHVPVQGHDHYCHENSNTNDSQIKVSEELELSQAQDTRKEKHLLFEQALNQHLQYGTWLYYPSNGLKKYVLHLHGRHYVTCEMKQAKKMNSLAARK